MVVANHNDNDLSKVTTEKITRVASVGPGGRWKPAYQSISDANWYGACHPPRVPLHPQRGHYHGDSSANA